MSELSRLRKRWIRIERRIHKLQLVLADALEEEQSEIQGKIAEAESWLTAVKEATNAEELRLLSPDAKLIYKPKAKAGSHV